MKRRKFKIFHLLAVVLVVALCLATVVEQKSVTGQSSTSSPDGNWSLELKLTEFSTLFRSRKVLDAAIEHKTNSSWDVSTSIPFNSADAETISNLLPNRQVVWSEDSSTVDYWINEELEDWIKIEVNDTQHKFQRKLNSTNVTITLPTAADNK